MWDFVKEHWVIILIIVVIIIAGVIGYFLYKNRTIDASSLKTSITEQNTLKQEEGYSSNVYADSGGVLTVGYGHTGADVDALGLGASITSQQGLDFFNRDLYDVEGKVQNAVNVPLDQNQFDALVDFVWNTGNDKSDLFTYVNNQDWQGAADFLRNHYITDAKGNQLAGLITRRDNEANQIIS